MTSRAANSNDYSDSHVPVTSSMQNGGGYYTQDPIRSNPGSPSKRVAFKGLPNTYNHPVAPYQQFEMAANNPRLV